MSKGLLNSMVLKNLFEDVDGNELLPVLIEGGVITKEQVEEYYKANIKSQKAQKPTYSTIEDGVLVKFDERDLDKYGAYTTPKGVVEIGRGAFAKCSNLRKIHLSRDVVAIKEDAFCECKNLQHVTMTNSVRKIDRYAFCDCESLTAIKLSDNLKHIPEAAFERCRQLQVVILPNKVEIIDDYAFASCYNLRLIDYLPKTLEMVGLSAFTETPIVYSFMRRFKEKQELQKQEKGNTK